MILQLVIILTIFGFSSTLAEEEPHLLSDFHCESSGKFFHPEKCTAYVRCEMNLTAYEINCPVCEDPLRCPDGRLHYSLEQDACIWADVAGRCPHQTTPAPPPPSEECDVKCKQEGYCECFDTCLSDNSSSTGGLWHRGKYCDIGLYWNPDHNGALHGGSCDFWDNLSNTVQDIYRLDPVCVTPPLECYWEADPECDNMYFYLPEGSKSFENLQHLQCPRHSNGEQLYWNQEIKSCGFKCNHNPCKLC